MRRTRNILAALTLTAAITMLTAPAVLAGGGGGGAICDGFAQGDEIHMYDSCFAGTAQLVEPTTDTVTVTNDGEIPHTITATDGDFDLYLEAGESATLELPDDAVIPIYCTLHGTTRGAGMAGVIVRDGDTDVSPAAADGTAAPANLLAVSDTSAQQDNDGVAIIVAIIVAGLAGALSLLAITATIGVRRAKTAP